MLLKNTSNLAPPANSSTIKEQLRKVKKLKVGFRPYWHLAIYSLAQPLRLLPTTSRTIGPPKKLYESTADWHKKTQLGSYKEIYPAHHFQPTAPITPDKNISEHFAGLEHYLPTAFVAEIPQGRMWGNNGSIISPDDGLIGDVSTEFTTEHSKFIPDRKKHSIFRQFKLPPISEIEGIVAALSVSYGDVYYHWMLDLLPRIELLRRNNIDLDRIDKFIVNATTAKFQKETLAHLGIPEAKIIVSQNDKPFHIKADKLIVPSLPRQRGGSMPKWACDFLRSAFLTGNTPNKYTGQERIYISRGDAQHRQVKDEANIINYLNKIGFKSVTLNAISVVEQAQLFSQAKVIVSPHGAGLTNLVFCNPQTKIVEFFSPNYLHPGYWRLSNQIGIEYYCLQGDNQPLSPQTRPKTDNITLNLEKLANLLTQANIN